MSFFHVFIYILFKERNKWIKKRAKQMNKKNQSGYCLIRVFSVFNNSDYDTDERWTSTFPSVFHVKRNIKCQRSQTTFQDMLSEVQKYFFFFIINQLYHAYNDVILVYLYQCMLSTEFCFLCILSGSYML